MSKKYFLKRYFLSSLLFFVISTLLDFLLTFKLNDLFSYVFFFVLSFVVFGPMIAVLVSDFKGERPKRKVNLSI